jgi:hypothetical protein
MVTYAYEEFLMNSPSEITCFASRTLRNMETTISQVSSLHRDSSKEASAISHICNMQRSGQT